MRLFVVQHGDAVPKDTDPDRPLSDRGRADLQLLLDFLAARNTRIEQIFHSGKARARETAEILRPLLETPGELHEREGLAPNDSPDAFLEQIGRVEKDTLVASHMPFVARVVSQATTGLPGSELTQFLPGSVAGIERGVDNSWRLILFVRPDFLR